MDSSDRSTMNYSSSRAVIDTSISAMTKIASGYSAKWTDNWIEPWRAPEYVYAVGIAQELARRQTSKGIFCEYNARECVRESQLESKLGRKPKTLTKGARPDILLTDGRSSEFFRFCIEVKRSIYTLQQLINDFERCCTIIREADEGTIDDGAIVFLVHARKSGTSRETLRKRVEVTLIGEGKNFGDSVKRLNRLKSDFIFTPFLGKFGNYEFFDDENEPHCYDWAVGAVGVSKK